MGKQMASALEMRSGEDKIGLKQNRQVQAYSRKAAGKGQRGEKHYPRQQGKPMEAQAQWPGGETIITWEMRCPDLGHNDWIRFAGPVDLWRAVRAWAEVLDHDEARPIGWGKTVTIEARRWGREEISQCVVSGSIHYRYHVKAVA